MADSVPDLDDSNDQQPVILQLREVDRDLKWNNELFPCFLLTDIDELDPFNTYGKKRLLDLWDEYLAIRNSSKHHINEEPPSDRAIRMFVIWMQDVMGREEEKDPFYAAAKALSDTVLIHKFITFMNETYSGFTPAQMKTLDNYTINACNNTLGPLTKSRVSSVHTMSL